MTWLKLEDSFHWNPKVAVLSDPAYRLHVGGLCYCAQHLTDGFVPAPMLPLLHPKGAKHVAELVAVGLWSPGEGGWWVHDYLKHQRSRDEVERLSSLRAAAGKRGGKAKAKSQASASGLLEAEKRREEEIRETPLTPLPRTRTIKASKGGTDAVTTVRPGPYVPERVDVAPMPEHLRKAARS